MRGLVFSSFTNAYALFRSASRLGVDLFTTDENPTFPLSVDTAEGSADWLFFTEEASLRRALAGELQGNFLPANFPVELLDDKWAFVEWLRSNPVLTGGLQQWPVSSIEQVRYPCLLKAKHSWVGSAKLPRGWVCRSPAEAKARLGDLETGNLSYEFFFFQEWLGDGDCRVISVCGFHDSEHHSRNLTAVVERVASHTEGLSCSAAVQTIEDDWRLLSRTAAILDALEFTGPYEMEYLVSGTRVAVLELNPRFWMQHSIFLADGNGLVKRYLGIEDEVDRERKTIEPMIWIDGLHLIQMLTKLRLRFPLMVFGRLFLAERRVVIWPSVPVAIRVWLRTVRNRLMKHFRHLAADTPSQRLRA